KCQRCRRFVPDRPKTEDRRPISLAGSGSPPYLSPYQPPSSVPATPARSPPTPRMPPSAIARVSATPGPVRVAAIERAGASAAELLEEAVEAAGLWDILASR